MAKKMVPVMLLTPEVVRIMRRYEAALEKATGHAIRLTAKPLPLLDKIGFERFLIDVAKATGMTKETLLRRCRKRELVIIRQTAIYLMYQYSSTGILGVGRSVGYDHTTVIHSIQTIEDLLSVEDAEVTKVYHLLFNLINQYAAQIKSPTTGLYTPTNTTAGWTPEKRGAYKQAGTRSAAATVQKLAENGAVIYQEQTRAAHYKSTRPGTVMHAGSLQ